jgi:UDP-N-acetylglucosamine--N-acetylmuramyl-(pentapeptide) pyrophosphoryl-undecaprenol N-acetylglucosamine transferase
MEQEIVQRESDLTFYALPAAAIRGRGPLALLRSVATLARGTLAARRLLRDLQPAAILGTGGYVCVPIFVAARVARIPTLLYLPDVVPGFAVRFLARLATRVACNVEESRRYLPKQHEEQKLLVTGYPVRAALFQQDRAACRAAFGLAGDETDSTADDLPVLLVYGGSRGARSINRAIEALLPDVLALANVIHVCGREGDEIWLRAAADRLEPALQARYRLYPYLDDTTPGTMVQAFGAADLALCRSGASTLAELPAAGLPAVLVPYPYVHQDENADHLVRHGAAVKVPDSAMLPAEGAANQGALMNALQRLLRDTAERQQMAQQCRALARPDAASTLADALCDLTTREV